jgi:hypothetical protein
MCPWGRARERLAAKVVEIEAKIASLQELKDAIRAMLDREDGTGVCGSFPPHIVQPPPRHKRTPMAENDSCSCGCATSSCPW